ncbi:hypothetical protein M422DRAFT_168355, partial [Sphaerobolus stellatus SS14]
AANILNMESRWKALAGKTDFYKTTFDKPSHKLAFDILVDHVCQFIVFHSIYVLGKIDALVFAGGLGKNTFEARTTQIHLGTTVLCVSD